MKKLWKVVPVPDDNPYGETDPAGMVIRASREMALEEALRGAGYALVPVKETTR